MDLNNYLSLLINDISTMNNTNNNPTNKQLWPAMDVSATARPMNSSLPNKKNPTILTIPATNKENIFNIIN